MDTEMPDAKPWLTEVQRTPPLQHSRLCRWRLDKNEFLPDWHTDLFEEFQRRLRPEHICAHPELGTVYHLLADYTRLPESNILVGAGSDLCIHAAFDAFVRPGCDVVIPAPSFLMYDIYAKASGAHINVVDYRSDMHLSVDDFCNAITSVTALACLPNPGSPIGAALSSDSMKRIIVHAEGLGVPLLVDEAYYPFYTDSVLPLVTQHTNLIVTRTFSKAAGLAGARIGFAAANASLIQRMRAFKPMYEITFPSVLLAELILENMPRVYKYAMDVRAGRAFLDATFRKHGYSTYQGEANFLLANFGKDRESITTALTKLGVLFKSDFTHPVLHGWSRFSIGPLKLMEEFNALFENVLIGICRYET